MRARLAPLAALALLAASAAAQHGEDDPRFVDDPRVVADPRAVPRDPRDPRLDPHAVPEGRDLFDALLAQPDDHRLALALSSNPWIVLDYVHEVCTRRMVLQEGKALDGAAGQAQAAQLQEQARRLARLADQAMVDTRFTAYVEAALGWDEPQIARYRERERLLDRARDILFEATSADDAMRALTPLEALRTDAMAAGDTRSLCRSLVLIGRVHAARGLRPEAEVTMREALRIGSQVRDFDAVWEALSTLYEAAVLREDFAGARELLRDQYLIAQDSGDVDTAQSILHQLVNLENLIRRGRTDLISPRSAPTPAAGGGRG